MAEFFSDWHRQTFIDALKREVAGCEQRLATLPDAASPEWRAECEQALLNAKRELAHVTGSNRTERRPRAVSETR